MRWLWQHAARWAGAQVLDKAKRAAVDQMAPDEEAAPDAAPACAEMAVVCETKRLFDAVADTLSSQRRVQADRFALCSGRLAGKPVVVARPLAESPSLVQLITALVDGHQPRFVVSAAEATSLSADIKPGSIVVASRVFDATGKSMRLDGVAPDATGYYTGGVASRNVGNERSVVAAGDAPLVEDAWSEPMARACKQVGLAMMAASVVLQPVAEQRSREAESLKKQSSLAGRAGVLAGMLWKKRSGLRDVWNEKEATWEACSRLAKLVERLANATID